MSVSDEPQRVFLTRHAQAEHNVSSNWSLHDPPLTQLGEQQAKTLYERYPELCEEGGVDLIISSPLRRTLQTTILAYGKTGAPVLIMPELQETQNKPCDTGSDVDEFPQFDFSRVPADWNSKKGFWADDEESLLRRAAKLVSERPEKRIAIVTHGGFLGRLVPGFIGFQNTETREVHYEGDVWKPTTLVDKMKQKVEGPADAAVEMQLKDVLTDDVSVRARDPLLSASLVVVNYCIGTNLSIREGLTSSKEREDFRLTFHFSVWGSTMEGRLLLFLLLSLCSSLSVADDCFFLDRNCTVPTETLPNVNSTVIFQSLLGTTLVVESLVVTNIVIRESFLIWEESNVSAVRLTLESSIFKLKNSTLSVQDLLSTDLDGVHYSQLELSDSIISSNTTALPSVRMDFTGTHNVFNSTSTHIASGKVYISSPLLIWNGHLNVSLSELEFGKSGCTIDTQSEGTSWTIGRSYMQHAKVIFSLPITLEDTETSDTLEASHPSEIFFNRYARIQSCKMNKIHWCRSCYIHQSLLSNLPNNSMLHLSGAIYLTTSQPDGGHLIIQDSIIEGSADLIINSTGRFDLDRVTLIASNISSDSIVPEIAVASWNINSLHISNSVINGTWSLTSPSGNLNNINGSSLLDLKGRWGLSEVQGRQINLSDYVLNDDNITIAVDRLIIGRLTIASTSNFIQLRNTTSYTINEIYLQSASPYTLTPVMSGIPNLSDHLISDSVCSRSLEDSSVSVHHNTTALYVTYVPPTPDVTFGYSDGISTRLRLGSDVSSSCTDQHLANHDLVVQEADGQERIVDSSCYGGDETLDGQRYDRYKFDALADENGCTEKIVKVYLVQRGGIVKSAARQVQVWPGDIVASSYYPWGNYNEPGFCMTAEGLNGILIQWNVSSVQRPCGYRAENFIFGKDSVSVDRGEFLHHSAPINTSSCLTTAQPVPTTLSIFYSKNGNSLQQNSYAPVHPQDSFFSKIIPVEPFITPDDFDLAYDSTDKHTLIGQWTAKTAKQVECDCGQYKVIVRLHEMDIDTWSTHVVSNEDKVAIPSGRYVMYVTGACSPDFGGSVGGYGRTVSRHIVLQASVDEWHWYTVAAIMIGVLSVFIIISVLAILWKRRRDRAKYLPIQ
ncbi:hypothetical protein PROFUN_03414 [Planoprotostelium fungivorum]|uniref:Phosphoglycerate mutase family protein n=1 Tax=Planoprotostelium fungivorum TaxID=1890364 RepID=A0A2P6NWH0_9EUKA|nr:hypothetical protein PROFUN_03414 [Planoprotostelium fungivorum]